MAAQPENPMLRELQSARNVVVRGPNALGDLIMATPTFARLAAHFGADHVSLVCPPAHVPLLEGNAWLRELIPYDRKGRHRGLLGMARMARELRQRRFDLGIILPNSFSSAWLFYRGGVTRRVGYFKEGRSFLLHAGRDREHDATGKFVPKYTGQYFMDLLDEIGLPQTPLQPTLPVTIANRGEAARVLETLGLHNRPFVVLAAGAAYGPSKLWPVERFAQVANELSGQLGVLLSYGPGEEGTVQALQKAAGREYPTTKGIGLGTFKGVYERAALVLTNDTGPRHLAIALRRPVVCVMGPNDPRYSALPGYETGEIIRHAVDCTPYAWPCQLKECPIDHRCMTGISVERVVAACRKHAAL